ncbi:hypothetical protein AMATHDRAFT_148277 [Amanita thiersii Skay4041]|uniref:Uncharacterized protein n=1 Tax=Amanita thiersii Skay4041 TaxID=703135 RepID=A0A2A9NN55_9AGAR|nr:hypothetical protein AMATHDRAFT_148277 [Amanita thiersii Skay4041]
MWIVSGAFDVQDPNETSPQKSKLLKTGAIYPLGRRDQPLVINNKRISKDHGEFTVGACTVEDISDPSFRPTLEYTNKKSDRAVKIGRGESHIVVNALSTEALQDGDIVWPVSNAKITVKWDPLCCYYPPTRGKMSASAQACASLGIHLVPTPNLQVTHHLTPSYTAIPTIALSLVSACHFVKPEWLDEVIRLGNLKDDDTTPGDLPLEQSFALPPLSKYHPSFSTTLEPSQKVFKVWEPSEERMNMFKPYRFFFVVEKNQEASSDIRDLIQRGGGTYDFLDIRAGRTKWHKALTRGNAKEGQQLVLVGKKESLKLAIDRQDWEDFLQETEIFGLRFVSPETIVQAVIKVDTTAFDKSANEAVDHPPQEPPTVNENDVPHERPRRLTRRVVSREVSIEPMQVDQETDTIRPRRALTRRVNAGKPIVTGLGDTSIDLKTTGDPVTQSKPPVIDLSLPASSRPSRLKRRVGIANTEASQAQTSYPPSSEGGEPPLKRHKTLFEDTAQSEVRDIDEVLSQLPRSTSIPNSYTQSQTQTGSRTSKDTQWAPVPQLPVVQEEEEESQLTSQPSVEHMRGMKRKGKDAEQDTETVKTWSTALKKVKTVDILDSNNKRAPQSVDKGQRASSKPLSSTKVVHTGTGNKLDIDAAFLTAIASSKKGKKKEDEFDRDFNNLRISRPELDQQEEEWNILDVFDDDRGIRGNFMVIVEMDVASTGARRTHRPSLAAVQEDWQGKPNFKKFKKKVHKQAMAKVDLVVNMDNEYGIGAAYWRGANSQIQSNETLASQEREETRAVAGGRECIETLDISEPDDEVERAQPPPKPKLTRSRKGARAGTRKAARPLFLDSDEEGVADGKVDMDFENEDDLSTLKSSAGSRSQKRGNTQHTAKPASKAIAVRPAPTVVAEDSDDGGVFKGFKGKKRGR